MEKYQWLAAIIAAHSDHKIFGRTRLQKTVMLLQRLGAPMDYDYMMFFYGPYSAGVQSDIRLLEHLNLVEEEEKHNADGVPYFMLKAMEPARSLAERAEVREFSNAITIMNDADATVLELAATYDAFREMGSNHKTALERLRRKKGIKCGDRREDKAIQLLKDLGLY